MLLFLIIATTSSFSQENSIFKGTAFKASIKLEGEEWTNWYNCDIKVELNKTTKRLVIHTPDKQIIDYVKLYEYKQNNTVAYYSHATDSKYKAMILYLIFLEDRMWVQLEYTNLIVRYELK